MRQVGPCTLMDALAAWGAHEVNGRLKGQYSISATDKLGNADLALRYRAPLLAHLLAHNPSGAIMVELVPDDIPAIFLADGRSLAQWIEGADKESHAFFRQLVDAPTPPVGPLFTAAHASGKGPIILYDGAHRAAAWQERCKNGNPSNISANMIIWNRF